MYHPDAAVPCFTTTCNTVCAAFLYSSGWTRAAGASCPDPLPGACCLLPTIPANCSHLVALYFTGLCVGGRCTHLHHYTLPAGCAAFAVDATATTDLYYRIRVAGHFFAPPLPCLLLPAGCTCIVDASGQRRYPATALFPLPGLFCRATRYFTDGYRGLIATFLPQQFAFILADWTGVWTSSYGLFLFFYFIGHQHRAATAGYVCRDALHSTFPYDHNMTYAPAPAPRNYSSYCCLPASHTLHVHTRRCAPSIPLQHT